METEVITPEPETIKKMEVKEMTGDQPATLLGKASLVEDVHSKHAGTIESSRSTEELVATQSLNNGVKNPDNEGQDGNSESDRYLELPALAEKHSEVSQEIEEKDTPVAIHAEGLENGSQIQKDQTGEIVEVTGNITESNKTDANGNEADVSKEQNGDVNVRENLHSDSITSSSGGFDQQEGKAEDESEAVIDNIEQKSDEPSYDKLSTIVGNSGEVMNGQKGEDEAVSSSQINTTGGKTSSEESELNNVAVKAFDTEEIIDNNLESTIPVKEEKKQPALLEEEIESKEKSTILDSTVEYNEKIYPTAELDKKPEDKNTELAVESLPEKTSFKNQIGEAENNFPLTENTGSQYSKVEEEWSPANTSAAPIDSQEERNAENAIETETQDKNINNLIENDDIKEEKFPDESKVDKLEIERNDIQEPALEEMHKDLDYPSVEQVQKGAEIVERHDEEQSDIKEEDCTVKDRITESNGEQEEYDSVKENNVAEDPKEEVNEELLVIEDEHNEKQDKYEDIEIQKPSTEATEDKNEVTEEPVIVGADNDIGHPLMEQEVVLDPSTVTNGEEPFKNDQEEVKENEGLSIVGEDKEIDNNNIDDDAVEDHPEATSDKEPLKDGNDEEKIRESAIASSDKDIKEPTVEEHTGDNSTEIIEEEPLEDGRDEKEETGVSQVVGAEDTGENILEDGVIPGHLKNSSVGEPFEEGHQEEKALEEPKTPSADQDSKEPIIEEVVSDHSTTNIENEQVRDAHEEREVSGESELLGKEYTGEAVMERGDGLYPSKTEIIEEPVTEDHNEEKKAKELEIVGVGNSTEETISQEVVPNQSASISSVESVSESYEENLKDLEETVNVEDIVQDTSKINIGNEQIELETGRLESLDNVEETTVLSDIVPDHSETYIKEEAVKDGLKDEKETEEIQIAGMDKSISEPITEVVPDHSTTITNDKSVQYCQEEKVSGGSEIDGAEKDVEEAIKEADILPDHSETTIVEDETKEDNGEEKVSEDLEIVDEDKKTVEPITGDVSISSYSETILEESIKDGHEDEKVSEDLEIVDEDKKTVEPIARDVSISGYSETTLEEPIRDGHEDEKVSEDLERVDEDKKTVEPIAGDVSISDYSETTLEEPIKDGHKDEKVSEDLERVDENKKTVEPIAGDVSISDYSETTLEEPIKDDHKDEKVSEDLEIVDEDEKIVEPITGDVSSSGYSETTLEEPIKDGHEDEKDNVEPKIAVVDKSVSEPIEEVLHNHSTTVLEDESVNNSHEEKVSGDSELAAIDKDIQDAVQEEDVVPDFSETTFVDEQIEASHSGDKLNEDQEISVEDKNTIDPITKEVVSDYSTTVNEDGHDESKASGGSQVASDEAVEVTIVEKDTTPDYSETTVKDEPIKDVDDEVKESEERDIVGEEKSIGEAITEVVQDHSTSISGDEPAKDSREEKISGGLVAAVADKDIGDNVKEEDVFPDRLETPIPEEQIEEVTKEQEIVSVSTDIKEPVIEEAAFPDYTTAITEDDPGERKVTGESQTPGIDDMRETITEKDISQEDTEATTKEEPIIDVHEEEKVSGGSQVASDEAIEATSVEKDGVPEYSETTVKEDEANKDVDDEVKASEETDMVEEKSIEEPIDEEVAQNHSTCISGDEQAEDSNEEKVSGGLVIAVAEKDIGDNVKEEDVFPDHIETPITEEQIGEKPKVTGELEIASVSRDIKEPLKEEAAFPDYTMTITKDDPEESKVTGESQTPGIEDMREAITEREISPEDSEVTIIDGHEEEKVNEELETPSADETTGNPILEDVVLDRSGTIIENDSNKENIEESKVAEESQIVGEDKNLEEVPCNSEKEKDTEETEKDSADKDITEAITEEAIVPTFSTTITEDETMEAAPLMQVTQEREIAEDASIAAVPAVSGSEETTKEDSQEDIVEPSKHEVEAKEYDLSMEPATEEQDSTEKVERVDSVEEENEHKNRDLDNVIETSEKEQEVPNDISEDHTDIASELNYEVAEKTEEIEKVNSKESEDLHEIQETNENKETTEEEETHQESSEMLGETSSLAPFVSEDQTIKGIMEEEKSRDAETVESNDSNITQQLRDGSEIATAKPEDKIHVEDGGIPEEEVHNVEFQEMNKEQEITTSQTPEEKIMDEETSLTQKGETESIKLEETDETDSTELSEKKNIELEPKVESQDEIYPSVVEHSTITSAENKEVCAEPAVAVITEDPESIKEQSPNFEDVTSVHDVEETIDVSHEKEKADSSNPNEEVYKELELVAAKDDAENLTMDTEQTKVDSQEDDGIETPGEEKQAKDSDSVSTMVETDSTKEREILPLEEEKGPKRSSDDFIATDTPLEEYTSTERSTEIDSSTKPLVTEEQDIDEVSEKTTGTSNNHESESSTSLTEKLSLHDAELEPEVKDLVNDSDISSKELFSPAIEGNSTSPRASTVEDLEHSEDVTTDNVLVAETLVANEVEQKQSEIPEETAEVQDRSIIEDEIEGPLVSETKGDENFEVEANVKRDDDAEMVVESTEQKISVSDSESLKHVSEPQVKDVVLDTEESIDTNEVRDGNIVEASELDATSTDINRETYDLDQNATLAQNTEADGPCEEFPKDTESADTDHSLEVLPETEKRNGEIINEQLAEDPAVDESIQEKIKENKNLQEVDTYLDATDDKLEAMSFEKTSDLASQIPTFNNEKMDQESVLVENNVELESYLSAGDQKLDELMSPEKPSDLVSQNTTLNNEKIDQDSVVVEKNVKDVIETDMPVKNTEESSEKNVEDITESDIPVKNIEESYEKNMEDIIKNDIPVKDTEESSEKNVEDIIESDLQVKDTEESYEADQKNVETSIPRELNEPSEPVYQEKTNDDKPIAPSLDEETSIGDVGGASAEEILQEGKEEDVINKAICESIDDDTKKSNEGTLSDEVPKNLENASDIQNNERQSLEETEAAKESFQEFSSDNANPAREGDNVDEEAAMLVNDEQVSESNAEKSTGDDTYEAKAPEDGILNQEVPEGSKDPFAGHKIGKQITAAEGVLEDPNLVAASRESVQLTQQEADVEKARAKELSTTSEPEKLYPGDESLENPTDDSSNAKETSKNEIAHEMLTSHEVVFSEEEIINQEDFTGRPVTFAVKTEQNVPTEETPILVSKHLEEESVYAPEELTHETLSKAADVEGIIPKDASDTESFIHVEKPADYVSVPTPMSVVEISPTKGEIPKDNAGVSSLTETPLEEIQEKEGNCTEDDEKQEIAYTKKGTNEESGEETKREIPLVQTSEGMKTSELDLQEKSCPNEEGEPRLSILQESSDAPDPKQISLEAERIQKTEENSSGSNTDVSSFPIGVTEKSLEEDEIDDTKHGEAQGHDSQVNDAKYNADKELDRFDETNTDVKLSENDVSSLDMMDKSSNRSLQTDEQSEEGNSPQYKRLQSNKALTIDIKDAEKTDQKEKDEEGEEDEDEDNEEHKKDDSGSDAPVMVEASKDIDMKTTPKKSHGILHGVGSKVKHSISKVKKAITGKSSPHKQSSPKT